MKQKDFKQAIGKYIVIKPINETLKESDILISAKGAQEMRYKKAQVMSVGAGVGGEFGEIKEGNIIYYDSTSSFTMIINETNYTIIKAVDVIIVLE